MKRTIKIKQNTPVHYRLLKLKESGELWQFEGEFYKVISALPIFGSKLVLVELVRVAA